MRITLFVVLMLLACELSAQNESWIHADFRAEGDRMHEACKGFSLSGVGSCAYELFTDHPMHFAVGSLPPQNGFGVGAAFAEARETRNWRVSWDVDAVGTTSASWRTGAYVKFVHTPLTPGPKPVVHQPGEKPEPKPKKPISHVHPYTIYNLYGQTISLNKINYFGEGNDTTLAGASVYGMRETILGASVIKPVYEWSAISGLNLSLLGEMNGRFVNIRGESGQSVPSIETIYTDATAPGLSSQPGFVQFGEGIRIQPVLFDYLQLNYLGNFQEFVAPSDSEFSFERWTVDLNHTVYFYGYSKAGPAAPGSQRNGPDSCAYGDDKCPPVPHSRNLNGSLNVRLLLSESLNSATSAVPFYFQQTLGGGDLDGGQSLDSYQDYRFRGPNLLLLQGCVEHSVWGPFGLKFTADEGRVALARSDVGFSHLKHSFAAGLTLRAGGFPMVSMMFAWGGSEGTHNIFNMNDSLLGGSARPMLQ